MGGSPLPYHKYQPTDPKFELKTSKIKASALTAGVSPWEKTNNLMTLCNHCLTSGPDLNLFMCSILFFFCFFFRLFGDFLFLPCLFYSSYYKCFKVVYQSDLSILGEHMVEGSCGNPKMMGNGDMTSLRR